MIDQEASEKIYSEEKLDTSTYKCPNCGGESEFSAKDQKMKCLYCGSLFDVDNNEVVEERNLGELLTNGQVWDEAEVYQCQSCGAKEILYNQEVAMECPFCGTNNVIKTEDLPGLKPQGIAPFKIDKQKSSEIAIKWAKKKKYAPQEFRKSAKAENIHGVYNPVFTFDADTDSSYDGQLGENYTVVRHVNGKRVTETRTRYFHISGNQSLKFDDVLIQASSDLPANRIKEIEPFPTNNAPEYRTEYLRGYSASSYNKEGSVCWEECKLKMKEGIERAILKRYRYDVKVYLNVKTIFSNEKYKYILVPVYVGHYKYKDKLYNFYINGDNGKITGKTPVSVWKVLFTVLAVLLVIGGMAALIALS